MNEWWKDSHIFDTLPLSVGEYVAILSRLDAGASGQRRAEQRKHARVRYRRRDTKVLLQFADGSRAAYVVKPHNLSARGMSFLHGFYVHPNSHCETALRTLAGKVVVVPGETVRCRHVGGKTHEIGVEFGRAIDLQELVPSQDLTNASGGRELGSERFSGRLLYVDDSEDDRELTRFMISELGIELHMSATAQEALARSAGTSFDAIMTKMTLPDMAGPDLAKLLRAQGCRAPIVAVVSNVGAGANADAEIEALAKGCDCILGTPLTASRLIDLFRGILPRAGTAPAQSAPLVSEHWSNAKMRPLILKFVARLEDHVRQLEHLLKQDQAEECARVCRRLVATSQNYGYAPIAELTAKLGKAAEERAPLAELRAQLDELNRLVSAARLVPN